MDTVTENHPGRWALLALAAWIGTAALATGTDSLAWWLASGLAAFAFGYFAGAWIDAGEDG